MSRSIVHCKRAQLLVICVASAAALLDICARGAAEGVRNGGGSAELPQAPKIVKLGTLGLDLCETTPFVFRGKLYRLEWFRKGHYLRIMDHATQQEVSQFGPKHRFPCAYVNGDTVYVAATLETQGWTGDTLTLFTSQDLKKWETSVIFKHPQAKPFCNTSICKADGRYVMSYEQNEGGFHAQFLESKDLLHWTMLPNEQRYQLGRYNAPHCLRWHDGWFYLFYLEAGKPHGYETYITRSRDLIHWDSSPLNPVLAASEEDKRILNASFSDEQRAKIAKARDVNNSDIDFCEFNGKLIINYSWGNQHGTEFIAEAEFAGMEKQFLTGWFPDGWAGIDLRQPASTFLKHRRDYGSVLSAKQATVTVSSGNTSDLAQLLRGNSSRSFAFHTRAESNPWVTIDLGREAVITGILVRNRTDCCQERAENLRFQVSSNNQSWQEIWKASGIQPLWEISLIDKGIKARYVRFDLQPKTPASFHLQHIEIWGREHN